MTLFYTIKEGKGYRLIQFSKFFIVFNYSIYVSFAISIITAVLGFRPLSGIFGLIAVLFAISRSVILFRLKYVNKKCLKEGSMFSLSKPFLLKYLNKIKAL